MDEKRIHLWLLVILILVALQVGCQNQADQPKVSKQEPTIRKQEPTKPTAENITMLDVLTKAQQTMSKQRKYKMDVYGDLYGNLNGGDLTIRSTYANQPIEYHKPGSISYDGVESFFAYGILIQKDDEWFEMIANYFPFFNHLEDTLKQFQALIVASQAEKETDGLTMTKTKNHDFQIKIDVQPANSKILKKNVLEAVQTGLHKNQISLSPNSQIMLENLEIASYQATLLFDGKNFALKKLNVDCTFTMTSNENYLISKQTHAYTFKRG